MQCVAIPPFRAVGPVLPKRLRRVPLARLRGADIVLLTVLALLGPRLASAQPIGFVDWTSIDPSTRTLHGNLGGSAVTLGWSIEGQIGAVWFDQDAPYFGNPAFTPALTASDGVEIVGLPSAPPTYTVTFATPVVNPVLHIASLASTLSFAGVNPTRLSGDQRFEVSGNQVSGSDFNTPNGIDANGTVRLPGTFASISFTAHYPGPAPLDGIGIQIGGWGSGLALFGLEVVQVVQDWRNSAPLVAGKFTAVRAHVADVAGIAPPGASFHLRAFAGDAPHQPLDPPFVGNVPGAGFPLQLPPVVDSLSRSTRHESALFWLPAAWLGPGRRRFVVEGDSVELTNCVDSAPPAANDCAVDVDFQTRQAMVVRMIPTQWWSDGVMLRPTSNDLVRACGQLHARFPAAEITCTQDPRLLEIPTADAPPTSELILKGVEAHRKSAQCGGNCSDYYLAVTASGVCADVACTRLTLGEAMPFKPGDPSSRGAWAAAPNLGEYLVPHELGHNFGLHHPTNEWTGAPLPIIGIFKKGECGPAGQRETFYALPEARYPPTPGGTEFFPDAFWRGDAPLIGPLPVEVNLEPAQELVFGYRAAADEIIPPTRAALMSYCNPAAWPDIDSYRYLFDQLAPGPVQAPAAPLGTPADFLRVAGGINRSTLALRLEPVERWTLGAAPPPPPAGEWDLIVHSDTAPDQALPLEIGISNNDPVQGRFAAFIPDSPSISGFTVRRLGETWVRLDASTHAPALAITSPLPGAVYVDDTIVLAWDASDADGDGLSFRVEFSADGGDNWSVIAPSWPASPFAIQSELVQASGNARFRVSAQDGFHSTTATLAGDITVIRNALFQDGFDSLW